MGDQYTGENSVCRTDFDLINRFKTVDVIEKWVKVDFFMIRKTIILCNIRSYVKKHVDMTWVKQERLNQTQKTIRVRDLIYDEHGE